MKKNLLILLYSFVFCFSYSQESYLTHGIILCRESKDPLITVSVHTDHDSTLTQWNGKFELTSTKKPTRLTIKYRGYDSKEIQLESNEKKEIFITIELEVSKIKWEKESKLFKNVLYGKWKAKRIKIRNNNYVIRKINSYFHSYFEIDFKSDNSFNYKINCNWGEGAKYKIIDKSELEFKKLFISVNAMGCRQPLEHLKVIYEYNEILEKMTNNLVKYKKRKNKVILIFEKNKIIYQRI